MCKTLFFFHIFGKLGNCLYAQMKFIDCYTTVDQMIVISLVDQWYFLSKRVQRELCSFHVLVTIACLFSSCY